MVFVPKFRERESILDLDKDFIIIIEYKKKKI